MVAYFDVLRNVMAFVTYEIVSVQIIYGIGTSNMLIRVRALTFLQSKYLSIIANKLIT